MVCDISEYSLAFLGAMATSQQSSPSKVTMFDLTAEDQLQVVCNLHLRQSAGYMHLALSCKRRLLLIVLAYGVLW